MSGGADLASDAPCGRLDHNEPGDGHGTGEVMVAGHGVIGTDSGAAVVTHGYRWRGLADRRAVEAIHDVSLIGGCTVLDG